MAIQSEAATRRPGFLALLAVVCLPGAALPQGAPLGPEFRVNTSTTGNQSLPSVASDASGNFVVVWHSPGDGSNLGIFGQRYASSGAPLGPEFRVNTFIPGYQFAPSVAADAAGNFVVVWTSALQDGSSYGVFGQRYASSGAPLGPEFRVNTYTTGYQVAQAVAADSSGNFVVVWYSEDGSNIGIFGQRYASSGAPLGPEFQINTYTTGYQDSASVAADSSGNFVVVWLSGGQDGSGYGVFGQRYASSGAPAGPEVRVNTYTTSDQYTASVGVDPSGNFVVAWTSAAQGEGLTVGVFGQRYASSGAPLGPEFLVNTYTQNYQSSPSVAPDPSGGFVVVWSSYGQDGSSEGVFGQRYLSSGAPTGSEFRVSTYTTGVQDAASVAADSSGNFVVVWMSIPQDGSGYGIFGQRYGPIVPLELVGFGVE